MSEEFNEENVTMADLEDHFDDANPWNVVQSYLEKGTVLPVKIEGIVNGGAIAMGRRNPWIYSCFPTFFILYRRSGILSVKRYRSSGH